MPESLQVRRLVRSVDVSDSWTAYLRDMNLRIGEAQAVALEDTMKFYEDQILSISDLQVGSQCTRTPTFVRTVDFCMRLVLLT